MKRTWKTLWCVTAGHSGRETIWSLDVNPRGVTTTRLTRETCLQCGRVII